MVDHSQMKLGRKPVRTDARTLRMARYMTAGLPDPPASVDWGAGVAAWGMMLNDRLGDCTIAGCGHAIQTWSAHTGKEATVSDQEVLDYYERWDGYDPADPSTDRGGVELDVLTRWRRDGLNGHRLLAFAGVNCADIREVRQAVTLFGGVYIGLSLPLTAQRQDVWDLVTLDKMGSPGSWGGHCVWVTGYDDNRLTCVTWGARKQMTVAFFEGYCEEAYALLGSDWIGSAGAPSGFNLDALKADLQLIH